jgi:hypothetical protein
MLPISFFYLFDHFFSLHADVHSKEFSQMQSQGTYLIYVHLVGACLMIVN